MGPGNFSMLLPSQHIQLLHYTPGFLTTTITHESTNMVLNSINFHYDRWVKNGRQAWGLKVPTYMLGVYSGVAFSLITSLSPTAKPPFHID